MTSSKGFFQRIKALSTPQTLLFAVALTQRMQPNFKWHCQHNELDHLQAFNDALLLLWQRAYDRKLAINYEAQQLKLERIMPEITDASHPSVYGAFDAVMAIATIFNALESEMNQDLHNVSKLSSSTVHRYLILHEDTGLTDEALNDWVFAHPLMQDEQDMQNMLLEWVEQPEALDVDQVKGLRQELLANLVSNLGIDANAL
jgi:uncharacterized protein YjaG (DUF416 family)